MTGNTNVIYMTNQEDWLEAGMAKKELAFHRARNRKGLFDEAIAKEEALLRSFKDKANSQAA